MNLKEEPDRKTVEMGDGDVRQKSSDRWQLVEYRENGGEFSFGRETDAFSGCNKSCAWIGKNVNGLLLLLSARWKLKAFKPVNLLCQ